MKRRFLLSAALAGALMLGGCDAIFGDDEVTVTVTDTANVRDAATTDGSNVIAKIEAGTELSGEWVETGTGPTDKWLVFDFNGKKAFVWAGNIKEVQSPALQPKSEDPVSKQTQRQFSNSLNNSEVVDWSNSRYAQQKSKEIEVSDTRKIASKYWGPKFQLSCRLFDKVIDDRNGKLIDYEQSVPSEIENFHFVMSWSLTEYALVYSDNSISYGSTGLRSAGLQFHPSRFGSAEFEKFRFKSPTTVQYSYIPDGVLELYIEETSEPVADDFKIGDVRRISLMLKGNLNSKFLNSSTSRNLVTSSNNGELFDEYVGACLVTKRFD